MPFTLTQLHTFRLLARLRSYSRVAKELGLTQPAITRQIHELEKIFDLRLVEVVRRQAQLTEAGRFLAERSELLLGDAAALRRDMHEFSRGAKGSLEVGATVTIGTYALPRLLARFRALHPEVTLHVEVGNTEAMQERLRSGRLGLALIEGSIDGKDLEATPYQSDDLVLVVPSRGHRFSARRFVQPGELADETLILREAGSGTRAFAERMLRFSGVTAQSIIGLASAEAAIVAVEERLGIAILSSLAASRAVGEGHLRIVPIASVELRRWFQLVKLKNHTLSPAARQFQAIVLSEKR